MPGGVGARVCELEVHAEVRRTAGGLAGALVEAQRRRARCSGGGCQRSRRGEYRNEGDDAPAGEDALAQLLSHVHSSSLLEPEVLDLDVHRVGLAAGVFGDHREAEVLELLGVRLSLESRAFAECARGDLTPRLDAARPSTITRCPCESESDLI